MSCGCHFGSEAAGRATTSPGSKRSTSSTSSSVPFRARNWISSASARGSAGRSQAVNLHAHGVRSAQPVAKAQPRVRAHRRSGHGIEHHRRPRPPRVAHEIVEILRLTRSARVAIGHRRRERRREIAILRCAAQPPALLDLRFVILEHMHAPRQPAGLDHARDVPRRIVRRGETRNRCEQERASGVESRLHGSRP